MQFFLKPIRARYSNLFTASAIAENFSLHCSVTKLTRKMTCNLHTGVINFHPSRCKFYSRILELRAFKPQKENFVRTVDQDETPKRVY